MSRRALAEAAVVVAGYAAFHAAFFAPVLFGPRLLAPDDGWTFFLPGFLAGPTPWTDLLLAGFPVMADPQAQSFYPVARLFALLPAAWDAYVVSGYVLASSFAYGYARAAGGSRLAAAVAGLAYGTSGFLVAHLRHVTFVHTAAWLPLLLAALERLRAGARPAWLVTAAAATALAALAGSPQLLVYGLVLGGAYAAFAAVAGPRQAGVEQLPGAGDPWRSGFALRYAASAALAVGLGLGLAAVQLLPAAELARLSPRATLALGEFGSYALLPSQLPLLLFPYFEGGAFGRPYAGPWNLAELSGYPGMLPLLLAGLALLRGRPRGLVVFWACAALVALLLALGTSTPLGDLAYRLPGVRLFKAPGRHFLELSMAVAALAALGADALVTGRAGTRASRRVAAVGSAVLALAGLAVLTGLAGSPESAGRPAALPALLLPLLVFAAGAAALLLWSARPRSSGRSVLLVAAVAIDLASFGWLSEWRTRAPLAAALEPPQAAARLRSILESTGQRLLAASGHLGRPAEIPVNTSRIWGVPSAGGYNPLLQERLAELVPMANWGAPHGPWASRDNRALDLLAVRYVTVPRAAVDPTSAGAADGPPPDGVLLGSGCGGEEPEAWTYHLPRRARADSLEIVTSLRCSTGIPQGAPVLTVTPGDRPAPTGTLRAGVDTAEWMFDCPGVREIVSHRRPPPVGSWALPDLPQGSRASCEWHAWRARLPLPSGAAPERITLRWIGPYGAIRVHRVALVAPEGTDVLDPEVGALLDEERWRRAGRIGSGVLLFENRRAMPRAWLVERAAVVSRDEALRAVRTSTLHGRPWHPGEVALVERPVALAGPADAPEGRAGSRRDGAGQARVESVSRSGGESELRVRTPTSALLVTSDAWYPGWKATVDGQPAPVIRADVVLRAVLVPPGEHTVRFSFEPRTLRLGALASAASGLVLAAVAAALARSRRPQRP